MAVRRGAGSWAIYLDWPEKPGEFELVVEKNGHYVVVEKFGEAAEVLTELDPRSQRA